MKVYEQAGITVEFSGKDELSEIDVKPFKVKVGVGYIEECNKLEVNNMFNNVRYIINSTYYYEHEIKSYKER
jgi:hypothetical protein